MATTDTLAVVAIGYLVCSWLMRRLERYARWGEELPHGSALDAPHGDEDVPDPVPLDEGEG